MRKALLFSLMTFLLMFSLILFGQAILKRDLASSEIRASFNSGAKAAILTAFVATDVLNSMNITDVHINRTNTTNVLIYFEKLSELPVRTVDLEKYRLFLQNNLSRSHNLTFSRLSNLSISPINSTISFEENSSIIYTTNYSRIRNITLTIRVNTSLVVNSSTPSADTQNQTITLNVIDRTGAVAFTTSAVQNPDEMNMPFSVFFNSSINSSVIVQFGVINSRNGTLMIRSNKLNAIPQDLKIVLDLIPEEVQIRLNSSVSYFDEAAQVQKNSSIIIRRG